MGGPGASVLLRQPLTDQNIDDLDTWLRRVAVRVEGTKPDWDPFWIQNGAPIGLSEDGSKEPCALGLHLRPALEEWAGEEDTLAQIHKALGYLPQQRLSMYIGCNHRIDHLTLGHLALTLAERFNGMIDMDGAITPPLQPGGNYTLANYPWQTLEEIHEFVQAMPGTIHEIYYDVNRPERWVFHIVDTLFLREWLKHPYFHMIK